MVTTIEISGYTEDILEALVMAGIYSSKTEAVRDSIRRLLSSYDMKDVALRAYRNGRVSFQLAAEVGGSSLDEMLWYMLSHNVAPELGVNNMDEVRHGADAVESTHVLVLDMSAVYTMLELGIVDYFSKISRKVVIPDRVRERSRALIMKMSKLKGFLLSLESFENVSGGTSLAELARRSGVSVQEAQAMYIAKKLAGVLISDDMRTRGAARASGVPAAPTLSVLEYLRRTGGLEDSKFKELAMRMGAIPYMVPVELS